MNRRIRRKKYKSLYSVCLARLYTQSMLGMSLVVSSNNPPHEKALKLIENTKNNIERLNELNRKMRKGRYPLTKKKQQSKNWIRNSNQRFQDGVVQQGERLVHAYENSSLKIKPQCCDESLVSNDKIEYGLKNNNLINVINCDSKFARAQVAAKSIEAGNWHFPDMTLNPWAAEVYEEMRSFPNAPHDDDVDSWSQFENYLFIGQRKVNTNISETIAKAINGETLDN